MRLCWFARILFDVVFFLCANNHLFVWACSDYICHVPFDNNAQRWQSAVMRPKHESDTLLC